MYRHPYDLDVKTFSPQGRLLQTEYSMEAVKRGSPAIGLRSKCHVVLAGVNRAPSNLVSASYPKKICKVEDQIGVAISGLTADGRSLYRYMQCESHHPVSRLVVYLANKAQGRTQFRGNRPYGAGLLVAGLDESGTHLYYNCPSGNYIEYQAFAIGSHSEAAKTYLESNFKKFTDSPREELIKEALIATRETLQGKKLKSSICTVAVVGVGEPFHILDEETVQQLIDKFDIAGEEDPAAVDAAEQGVGAEQEGAAPNQGVAPMDI